MYSEISNTLALADRLENLEATVPDTNLPATSPLLVNTKKRRVPEPEVIDLCESDPESTDTDEDPQPKRTKAFFGKF